MQALKGGGAQRARRACAARWTAARPAPAPAPPRLPTGTRGCPASAARATWRALPTGGPPAGGAPLGGRADSAPSSHTGAAAPREAAGAGGDLAGAAANARQSPQGHAAPLVLRRPGRLPGCTLQGKARTPLSASPPCTHSAILRISCRQLLSRSRLAQYSRLRCSLLRLMTPWTLQVAETPIQAGTCMLRSLAFSARAAHGGGHARGPCIAAHVRTRQRGITPATASRGDEINIHDTGGCLHKL